MPTRVDERFDKMEREISKLSAAVGDMKSTLDKLVMSRARSPYQESAVERIDKGPNPWALQTSNVLTSAMNFWDNVLQERITRASYEKYKSTIDALVSSPSGLTADQVSQKTGRRRNTESAYLYRLSSAGLVNRKRRKNKIVYILDDKEKLSKAFG